MIGFSPFRPISEIFHNTLFYLPSSTSSLPLNEGIGVSRVTWLAFRLPRLPERTLLTQPL